MSLRRSSYVALKSPKGGCKTQSVQNLNNLRKVPTVRDNREGQGKVGILKYIPLTRPIIYALFSQFLPA